MASTALSLTEVALAMPEIFMLISALVILLIDTYVGKTKNQVVYYATQLTLIITLAIVLGLWDTPSAIIFAGSYIHDAMASLLKSAVLVVSFFALLYGNEYLEEQDCAQGEYFVLGLFAILGMMVLISAYSLVTVYLGLELLSLSLYAMIAMHKKSSVATEAAVKYFVLGALASGMLLYGMSMIYGVTGNLELARIASNLSAAPANPLLSFGLVFMIAGIAFKLGAAPFHMWVPDVYQGAPTGVTLFIASAPKLAALAMAMRLLVDGLHPLADDWRGMLIVLALLSLAVGNIVAIAQTNTKRMLAYSAIAHSGYLLLGVLAGTTAAYAGALFYVVTYALMSVGAFGVVVILGRKNFQADELAHLNGLSDRNPWIAFLMLVIMFSMAGVPPFLGFWAKWFVLKELVAGGFVALAVAAVFFSLIGAYYYLCVVKRMYFDQADSMTAIKSSKTMRISLSMNGLALLIVGISPGALMAVCLAVL